MKGNTSCRIYSKDGRDNYDGIVWESDKVKAQEVTADVTASLLNEAHEVTRLVWVQDYHVSSVTHDSIICVEVGFEHSDRMISIGTGFSNAERKRMYTLGKNLIGMPLYCTYITYNDKILRPKFSHYPVSTGGECPACRENSLGYDVVGMSTFCSNPKCSKRTITARDMAKLAGQRAAEKFPLHKE